MPSTRLEIQKKLGHAHTQKYLHFSNAIKYNRIFTNNGTYLKTHDIAKNSAKWHTWRVRHNTQTAGLNYRGGFGK